VDGAEQTRGTKEQLRAELGARRRRRTPEQLEAARAAIRRTVLERADGVECVAAYVPLRTEPGSLELLAELGGRGVRVLVPLTLPDHDLEWTHWSPGIPGEPLGRGAIAAAALVLVPALAVALDGTRLGRGGGSYDRALLHADPAATVAALVFDDEVRAELPSDPWDVRVAAAITPAGWAGLGGNADFPSLR
jgi:5-formyltetrahydrofolate cyclo-ligase